MTARSLHCADCGRHHLRTSMLRNPDGRGLLCPVRFSHVMRLGYQERRESERLLSLAFGDESAPGHEFPAADDVSWPTDAADDWWSS